LVLNKKRQPFLFFFFLFKNHNIGPRSVEHLGLRVAVAVIWGELTGVIWGKCCAADATETADATEAIGDDDVSK
jgi:hypothetical protein